MANPRKFSEKIALHTHRQAEETAAFEKIMKEVSDVKPNEEPPQVTGRMASNNAVPRQSRTRSPGGPIRSTRERKPSPYSSGPYLSPPSDTGWRRTHSDSALHQSAMQGMGMERNDAAQRVSWGALPAVNGPDRSADGRPRSSCDIPRVPGINIYPSAHDPGMIQIPIGNNTGSLPDLTSVDFTSPLHAPLDQDQDNGSPYSSSPINTSPITLSPTNMMPGVRPHNNHFNFTPPISNHLSVPSNSRYSRMQQRCYSQNDKTIALDNTDFSQLGALAASMYQRQESGSPSSPVQLAQMDGYRSPRPSPQPSPTLGGRHSAPCSPGEPSPLQNDYHNIHNQNMQFQQHFEQLTVSDPPIGQMAYADQSSATSPQMSHSQTMQQEVSPDTGYYGSSPSQQLVFPAPSPGQQNTSPNTPTIILTDYSAGPDMGRQFEADFLMDEQLREGLGSLDFAELQMLNNMPEIVEDYRS